MDGLAICSFYATHWCCQVQHLSGGELQRVAMALCLGKPADIYLVDEPSAYLDSEQRLSASKVLCDCTTLLKTEDLCHR
jgi:translation initiation factor RLI1